MFLYLDYSGYDELFRLSWDRRDSNRFLGFLAEVLREPDGYTMVAKAELSGIAKIPRNRQMAEVQLRLDSFVEAVNGFLRHCGTSS